MKKLYIDVGASNIDIEFSNDLEYHLFEPRISNIGRLSTVQIKSPKIIIHPIALSNIKGRDTLNITKKVTCSSFLNPNTPLIRELTDRNPERFDVVERVEVEVDRLDNILPTNSQIKYLKIDTQGTEYEILEGCGSLLQNVEVIECEVEFYELYKGQKLASEVTALLISKGFEFVEYKRIAYWKDKKIFADAIYRKNETRSV